jgi:hypothetical protein
MREKYMIEEDKKIGKYTENLEKIVKEVNCKAYELRRAKMYQERSSNNVIEWDSRIADIKKQIQAKLIEISELEVA